MKPPAPERPRDRVLTDAEIRLFWDTCGAIRHPFGPLCRVLLLTGQRLREVAELEWREIDGDTWTLPGSRAKNADEHVVPLSPEGRAILDGLPRIGDTFAFTTSGETPVSGARAGVAGVYNRFNYATEKRQALQIWARHVTSLVTGRSDNVVMSKAI